MCDLSENRKRDFLPMHPITDDEHGIPKTT